MAAEGGEIAAEVRVMVTEVSEMVTEVSEPEPLPQADTQTMASTGVQTEAHERAPISFPPQEPAPVNEPPPEEQEPVHTSDGATVEEPSIQPDLINHPNPGPIDIPVVEGKHKGQVTSENKPIHVPRYLKNNRHVDWTHLPPSSINSPVIAQQQLTAGVPAVVVNGGGVNTAHIPQRPAPSVAVQTGGVNDPSKQRPQLLPAPQAPVYTAPQGSPTMMASLMAQPPQQNLFTVTGTVPNLTFSPVVGAVPPTGQVVQLNFTPPVLAQPQARPVGGATTGSLRRPPNMIGDVPKAKDAEKRRERERVRRAIMANIISGLRNYGGYNLPQNAPDIEYIRALLREAGYVTNVDGTTYRQGAIPPQPIMEQQAELATSQQQEDFAAEDTPTSDKEKHPFQDDGLPVQAGNGGLQAQVAAASEPEAHRENETREAPQTQEPIFTGEAVHTGEAVQTEEAVHIGGAVHTGEAIPTEEAINAEEPVNTEEAVHTEAAQTEELADQLLVEPLDEKRAAEDAEEGQEAKRLKTG